MILLRNQPGAGPDAPTHAVLPDTGSLGREPKPTGRSSGRRLRHRVTLALFVVSIVWLLFACTPRSSSVQSYLGVTIPESTLSAHLENRRQELGIPGLSVAVVTGGEVAYAETFGHADVEAGQPVTDETVFEGASLSKPVFAQFVMTFVDDGTLDLDRPLVEYLVHPDVENDEWAAKITARMVLSHQAGFPNWRDDLGVASTAALPIGFEPGTGYEYSGEGYQYLSMVLAEITSTDWAGLEALFQERIAEPLGLERMVFIQNANSRQNKAEPYDADGIRIDWENDANVAAHKDVFIGGASMHTTTADFTRWMIGLMDRELLSADSYRELFARHSTPPAEQIDASYTLGFYRPEIPLTDLYGHSGNNDGFTSFFILDTEDDWGFVVLTNSEYGQELGEELLLYLAAGPSVPTLVGTVAAWVFLVLSTLVFTGRALHRRFRGGSSSERTAAATTATQQATQQVTH